jgi:hypothetical protein
MIDIEVKLKSSPSKLLKRFYWYIYRPMMKIIWDPIALTIFAIIKLFPIRIQAQIKNKLKIYYIVPH